MVRLAHLGLVDLDELKKYEIDTTNQNNIDLALLATDRTLAEWELRMTQDKDGNGYVTGEEYSNNELDFAKQKLAEQKQIQADRKQAFAEHKFNKEFKLKEKQVNKPNKAK